MTEEAGNIARNELCPCGSGLKFKHCCGALAAQARPGAQAPRQGGQMRMSGPGGAQRRPGAGPRGQGQRQRQGQGQGAGRGGQGQGPRGQGQGGRGQGQFPQGQGPRGAGGGGARRPGAGGGQGQQGQGQGQGQGQPSPAERRMAQLVSQAQRAYQQGRRDEAEAAARQVLSEAPNHLGAVRMLFQLKREAGDIKACRALAGRMMRAFPDNDAVLTDVGSFLESRQRLQRAEQLYKRAVELNPRNFFAHTGLGNIAQRRGNAPMAEYHFREAYYVNPQAPGVSTSLAIALGTLGRKEESERFFKIALALQPRNVGALLAWVRMEESRDNMDRAWELLGYAKEYNPEFPNIPATEALLNRRAKHFDEALAALDKIDASKLNPGPLAAHLYERGQILDKLKRYDDAFEAYAEANKINREKIGLKYRKDRNVQRKQQLIEFFTKERMEKLPRAERRRENEEVPIFVCGFTRSGTSMMEQILASHPNIIGADELFYIADIANRTPGILRTRRQYPRSLEELENAAKKPLLQRMREEYLTRVRLLGILEPGAHRFTDKMPMNEVHMGLINLMFPDSHVVHMVRHPLDTVLASFFIDARHGDFCTYDLQTAAEHYAMIMDLVEHYRANLDIKYQMFRYEDLVQDLEPNVRKLLDFVEEPFSDKCIKFHENKRTPRTPSYSQVKEKVYTTSMYRYKNYRKHVEDIIPILAPYIKKLGYEVD